MSKETILVVDDSKQITNFLAGELLPSLGFLPVVANGGYQGLRILRENHQEISLMIVDLQMPDLGGLDLLRKSTEYGVYVPAILMTAHGSEHIAVEAFRFGVQDYLTKPLDVDQLSAAITNALAFERLKNEKIGLYKQLQEQLAWQETLADVGRSLTSTLDLSSVLRRIVEEGVSLTQADQGFIALVDPNSKSLVLRAVKNVEQKRIDTTRTPINDPLLQQALAENRLIRKSQPNKNKSYKVSTGLLVHDLIHVPINHQDHILGVLSVNKHAQLQNFSSKDEIILTSLADYAAIAIDNAYLYHQARVELEERKKVTKALSESEERYALAVRGSNDGLWDWDLKNDKIYYSPRWKEILGFQDEEIGNTSEEWFKRIKMEDQGILKQNISIHVQDRTSHFTNEHRLLHKDNTYRWVLCRGTAVLNGGGFAVRLVGSIADITDRKKAEEQLLHDAFHDTLTGLPNRKLFMDRLDQTIERMKRKPDYRFAVLFLDIDHFKDINDSMGHLIGDQFLIEIANILNSGLRSIDTLARFGGDEFLILLDEIQDLNSLSRVSDWIKEQFASPFYISGKEITSSVSIGIVLNQPDYQNAAEVIRNADIAMYVAKAKGRDRSEIFDKSMRQRFLQRLHLETDLKKAFENSELRVYYQPIINMVTRQMLGFEALVRWQHPTRGLLEPNEFIALAEETGLITNIDHWMLSEACTQIQYWNQKYKPDPELSISINISAKHIANPDLLEYIKKILDKSNLAPHNLKIEITELSVVDANQITTYAFRKLLELGVQIEIDDFGVGYSSLGYLPNFPISAIKIDQSFVRGICRESRQRNIIEAIILLSNRFNVDVIAEGIESEAQLQELANLGCQIGQGFFISEPLKPSDAEVLIRNIVQNEGHFPLKVLAMAE